MKPYLNKYGCPFFLGLGMFRLLFHDAPIGADHCKASQLILDYRLCFHYDSHLKIYRDYATFLNKTERKVSTRIHEMGLKNQKRYLGHPHFFPLLASSDRPKFLAFSKTKVTT